MKMKAQSAGYAYRRGPMITVSLCGETVRAGGTQLDSLITPALSFVQRV